MVRRPMKVRLSVEPACVHAHQCSGPHAHCLPSAQQSPFLSGLSISIRPHRKIIRLRFKNTTSCYRGASVLLALQSHTLLTCSVVFRSRQPTVSPRYTQQSTPKSPPPKPTTLGLQERPGNIGEKQRGSFVLVQKHRKKKNKDFQLL